MSNYQSQRAALEDYFKSNWETQYPDIPISWVNVELSSKSEFVRHAILNGDSNLIGLGNVNLHRYIGVISIGLFLELNKATTKADEISDFIDDLYRGKSISDITCRSVIRQDIGTDDTHYRVNLTIPFFRNKLTGA